jgi:hypothetical protein
LTYITPVSCQELLKARTAGQAAWLFDLWHPLAEAEGLSEAAQDDAALVLLTELQQMAHSGAEGGVDRLHANEFVRWFSLAVEHIWADADGSDIEPEPEYGDQGNAAAGTADASRARDDVETPPTSAGRAGDAAHGGNGPRQPAVFMPARID